jgi:hypothetical protein
MSNYTVTVHHPVSGKNWEMADLDPTITPSALVEELIKDGHLPRQPQGYEMTLKSEKESKLLNMDQSLKENGVPDKANLLVVPHSKGGAVLARPILPTLV